MKKGFTLVELMIVVVVLVTLMSVAFKLTGIGGDTSRRNTTITRLQKLENALSGYFAAYGSYPPVPFHGVRSIYQNVDEFGEQENSGETETLDWQRVRAACRIQPLAVRFPFSSDMDDYVEKMSRLYVERCNSNDKIYKHYQTEAAKRKYGAGFRSISKQSDVSGWSESASWMDVKVFQFGLMSYLLPRYMFMVDFAKSNGEYQSGRANLDTCAQWTENNTLSSKPADGRPYASWSEQFSQMKDSLIRLIPSQAVTARWMPNLEGIVSCSGDKEFFGVKISDGGGGSMRADEYPSVDVYKNYVTLDSMTVYDGWGNEFYYYSAPPYQSYELWSSGPNGKTFPPWMSLDKLSSPADKKTASNWMADDIRHLNN